MNEPTRVSYTLEEMFARLESKIDSLENKIDNKIDGLEDKLNNKIRRNNSDKIYITNATAVNSKNS